MSDMYEAYMTHAGADHFYGWDKDKKKEKPEDKVRADLQNSATWNPGHVHQDSSHVHEPAWTPGTAPRSTSVPTYPTPEPLKVSDVYTCPRCGGAVITTTGQQHICPPDLIWPSAAPGVSGWVCPACGKGNAPFVSQCPCGGRTGVSTTTNTVTITGSATGGIKETSTKCDCCGLGTYGKEENFKGYLVCNRCFKYHTTPYSPTWHSHNDEGGMFGTQKDGTPIRRYHFPDGTTYYNDDDPDDYK